MLSTIALRPRASGVGRQGRDGAVERVVAVRSTPAQVADALQQRDGARYSFHRTDLGGADPVVVELRGQASNGVRVVVTAQAGRIAPLYGAPEDLPPLPVDLPTGVSLSVISPQ